MRRLARGVVTLMVVGAGLSAIDAPPAAALPDTTPVWGFVWSNVASPQLNTIYTPSNQYQSGSWRSNSATTTAMVTIVRNSTGQYTVVFPRIGITSVNGRISSRGMALATAYGEGSGSCHAEWWLETTDAIDELVKVSCRDRSGNPADSRFTAMFTNGSGTFQTEPQATASAYLAYTWNLRPADEVVPLNQYNSDGRAHFVRRVGVGRYVVHLTGPSFTSTGGHVQVNVIHSNEPSGPPLNCVVMGWGPSGDGQDISVSCIRAGQPTDGMFAVVYSRNRSIMSSLVQGYVWSPNPPIGPSTAPVTYSANSFARANTIEHYATGRYRVRFPGVGRQPDHVQVTPYGDVTRRCIVAGWSSPISNWGDATASIDCFNQSGQLADTAFDAAYLNGVPIVTPN
jgi:hypothetical protein